ncbi:MAG: hypothetical protein U1E63_15075 [Burkholderiales bacterium]
MALEDILHPLLARYAAAPQWVRGGIGALYGALPKSLRHGRAFAEYCAQAAARLPVDALAREVDRRLSATLEQALRHVPAYARHRSLLDRSLAPRELLAQIPPSTKADLKRDLESHVSANMPPSRRLEMFTGGSTAEPMRFFAHKHVTRPKETAYYVDLDGRAGWRQGDLILNLRGRSVRGAGRAGAAPWAFDPIRRHLILSSDHLEARFMAGYVQTLREWKPKIIQAYPSALYPLAVWLARHPAPDVTQAVRGIVLSSESAYDFQLRAFRRVFDGPVIRGYGHTERVLLAATMPDDDRYFFWPLYGHLELLDGAGRSITEPGVAGEIVGTSFDSMVMPFVRYRTGDIGAWSASAGHPLLPGFPVLEYIDGRQQEFVVCRDERLVTVTTLGAAHFSDLAEVDAIQYEQYVPGQLILKVVSSAGLAPAQEQAIATAVRAKTQGGCEVRVERVDRIERTARGKLQMLVQHLDLSGFLGAAHIDRNDVHGAAGG